MESYTPQKIINVEDTLTWKYLCNVFGWSEKYNDRVAELLDRVAWKLQNPAQRSNKIHVIYSATQGIGKSAFSKFLRLIFGKSLCVFHSSLRSYMPKFDMHLSSKMVHFVDDIQGASIKQTRDIFPKVTENTHLYEAKGERVVEMNEYSELWISGNDKAASLYVGCEDRRIVIYEASPVMKNKHDFWRKLHKEFDDFDVQKAWYEYIKHRDIKNYTPDQSHAASKKLKFDSIASSMCKVHVFVERFLSQSGWHMQYFRRSNKTHREWYSELWIGIRNRKPWKGAVQLRISQHWLYTSYTYWLKQFFPTSRCVGLKTFLAQCEDIGCDVPTQRQRIHGTTRRVIDMFYEAFNKRYEAKYNQKASLWDTEDTDRFRLLKQEILEHCGNTSVG